MTQKAPKYPHMASCANPVIQNHLRSKYGPENVCWPIVWLKNDTIVFYTFELTEYCDTNSLKGKKPVSSSSKGIHFVSYIDEPRIIYPPEPLLLPSIDKSYECSYDYVIRSDYVTVDLDYVWNKKGQWIALEFTTFWFPFDTRQIAEDKVAKLKRRPSWKSEHRASAMLKQIEASIDLGITRFTMACVNTMGRVDNNINVEGNAYWFNLDFNQVQRLVAGRLPQNADFGTFKSFLQSL